jgi:hypothetical protein
MTHRSVLAILLAVALAAPFAASAESRPIELQWSELGSRLQGRDIELVLPDGTALRGEVEAIREDTLVLNVKKTSNSKAHPKGNALIPRTSVTLLSLNESRGRWGRTVGVTLGTLTGMALGGYVAAADTRSAAAGLSTFLALSGAGTLTGYFLGKSADDRVTYIRVVP